MNAQGLATRWRQIEASGLPGAAAMRFLDSGVHVSKGAVLLGIDGAGQRHLCVPAGQADVGREDRASKGVTVEVRPLLSENRAELIFVDVHCRIPALNGLFEVVAAEVLSEVRGHDDRPFDAAHGVLERWRELLEPEKSTALRKEEIAPLLAELLFLESLGDGTGPAPVRFWTGLEKLPHDFVCGDVDFEVKSTLTTTGRSIRIHGISQLSESGGAALYLWWVRLRQSPGRGTSLPDVVNRLLARGTDASELLSKLKLMRYQHFETSQYYANITFETIETALYRVDGTFPRIDATSFVNGLPKQVTKLDYDINLDASSPEPLSPEDVARVLRAVG